MCGGRFSRKGNAFRHNISLHNDLATIRREPNNLRIEKQVNKKNIQKNFTRKFEYFSENQKTKDDFDDFFLDTITKDFDYQNDDKILRIISQLMKPYLALEAELADANPILKPSILSNVLESCLSSNNPVKSFNEVAVYYRSVKGLALMSKNLSLSNGISIELATANIKHAIRNCVLYKQINN